MPDPFKIEDYEDPRFDSGPSWRDWLLLAFLVAGIIGVAVIVNNAVGDDSRPTLWVYTAPDHCYPCRVLDKALGRPPMNGFNVVRLTPPPGCSMPCLYWKDAKGQWQYQVGWAAGSERVFMEKWRRDTKR